MNKNIFLNIHKMIVDLNVAESLPNVENLSTFGKLITYYAYSFLLCVPIVLVKYIFSDLNDSKPC
jgi:hypothetical protein